MAYRRRCTGKRRDRVYRRRHGVHANTETWCADKRNVILTVWEGRGWYKLVCLVCLGLVEIYDEAAMAAAYTRDIVTYRRRSKVKCALNEEGLIIKRCI